MMEIPIALASGSEPTNIGPIPNGNGVAGLLATGQDGAMSADEIALYDRQIRLWGVQAQERLRTANVLLLGMRALANEVAKNLVLAGISSLTIVDDQLVSEDDLGAQFFISEAHIGMNRAEAALLQIQKLNPRVTLRALTDPIGALAQNPPFFAQFTVIIATDLPLETFSTLNASCRLHNRPFYAAATHGMYGFIFADLIAHDFTITRQQSNIPTKLGPESPTCTILDTTTSSTGNGPPTELVTKREIYSPMLLSNTSPLPPFHLSSLRRKLAVTPLLACLRALFDFQALKHAYPSSRSKPDLEHFTTLATQKHQELQLPTETLRADFLRAFLQNVGAELAPVTAFLGGQLAQDALNVIGGREQPIQNWVLFDGEENKGPIYSLHSVFSPLQGVAGLAGAVPGIGTEGRAGLGMGNGALPGGLAM